MWQDHFRHDFMTEVFLQIDENFDQTKITKINAIMKEVFKCLKMFLWDHFNWHFFCCFWCHLWACFVIYSAPLPWCHCPLALATAYRFANTDFVERWKHDLTGDCWKNFWFEDSEGQSVQTRRFERTARSVAAMRQGGISKSKNRVMTLMAFFACTAVRTRCPVSWARTAISAVSRSLILPTKMILACRRSERRTAANVIPMASLTATWLLPGNWYSTGSSTVITVTFRRRDLANGGVERCRFPWSCRARRRRSSHSEPP